MDKMRIPALYGITPKRLIELVGDPSSEISADHVYIYNFFWLRSTWTLFPIETKRLLISKVLEKIPYRRRHFYEILKALSKERFIERVYDVNKKRSRYIKIRFLFESEVNDD